MKSVIGLITANYDTEKLGKLTSERALAALPYGGRYRLIDFSLSNMCNSEIKTVGLITPHKYRSLIGHVGAGKEWSLARKGGGLAVLPGSMFGMANLGSPFLLRDFALNGVFLLRNPAPYVMVTAANTVYNMDYTALYQNHKNSGADITMVYRKATAEEPSAMALRTEGTRVLGVEHGARAGSQAFLDCFMINRELLLSILDWYREVDHLDLFDALAEKYEAIDVRSYEFEGYAANIYDTESYFRRSFELLDERVSGELFSKERPIITKVQDAVPTKYLSAANVKNALVSAGCMIRGTVAGSIIFRGVRVESGAVVRNSIIMQSSVIEKGAYVENAIIDKGNTICAGTVVKGAEEAVFVMEKEHDKKKPMVGAVS